MLLKLSGRVPEYGNVMIVARSHKISPYCFTGIVNDRLAIFVPLDSDGNRIRRT